MLNQLRPALVLLVGLTLLDRPRLSAGDHRHRPAAVPGQAEGSLVSRDGQVIGSALIGQAFTSDRYFHPRPSAAGSAGYDATASSGSNLGPTSAALVERVRGDVERLTRRRRAGPIPVDLVTASGSGLDPGHQPGRRAVPGRPRRQGPRPARRAGAGAGRVAWSRSDSWASSASRGSTCWR